MGAGLGGRANPPAWGGRRPARPPRPQFNYLLHMQAAGGETKAPAFTPS